MVSYAPGMARTLPEKQTRDHYLLSLLYLSPFTIPQLLAISQASPEPFAHWDTLYRRLERLRSAGWLRRFRYGIAIQGADHYYKLSPVGYRELRRNPKARPLGKYSFAEMTNPWHTYWLSEFIKKTIIAAQQYRITLERCWPDNTVRLFGDGPDWYPDFVFTFRAHNDQVFRYCIELDNNTKTIRSDTNLESLTWTMRRYEVYQYLAEEQGKNFRVLFVTTGNDVRARNIAAAAADSLHEPRRQLVLSCTLQDYLQAESPFTQLIFLSQRGHRAAMIPRYHPDARRPRYHGLKPVAWKWALA